MTDKNIDSKIKTDYKVVDVVLITTFRCNSRCIMCNIWKVRDHEGEFQPEDLKNLPPTAKHINLSGGEPFLRSDIVDIVRQCRKYSPEAEILFSTNGFLTDLIVRRVKEIREFYPEIGIRVSLDGIGEVHEHTRGIPHAFNKVIATIKALQAIGVTNLGFGYTILDTNPGEAKRVYNLSRDLGIQMSLSIAHNSEFFFQKTDNKLENLENVRQQLDYMATQDLKTFNPKRWARAFFDYGAWRFLKYKEKVVEPGPGKDSVFVDPKGNVYPADYINHIIGNIKERPINEIVNSPEAEKARMTSCINHPHEPWIICTLRGAFAKNKGKILTWALQNKLNAHLNHQILQ